MADFDETRPPPQTYYGPPTTPANEQQNQLGIWALVLAMASVLFCGLFTGVPAIFVGLRSQEAERQGRANNGMLGKVGLIVGIIGSAMWTCLAMVYILPFLLTMLVFIPVTLVS